MIPKLIYKIFILFIIFNTLPLFAQTTMQAATDQGQLAKIKKTRFAFILFKDINQYRRTHGLRPLYYSKLYTNLAQKHSDDMALRHKLDHQGFKQRFALAQSFHCVENAGWNNPSPALALSAWEHSDDHRKNLLDPDLTSAGIGIKSGYITFFACK